MVNIKPINLINGPNVFLAMNICNKFNIEHKISKKIALFKKSILKIHQITFTIFGVFNK